MPTSGDTLHCNQSRPIVAFYLADAGIALRGYEVTLLCTDELSFSPEDVHDAEALSEIGEQTFFCYQSEGGAVVVSAALLGETDGLLNSDALFSVEVTAEQTGTGQLIVDQVKLRTLDNQIIDASSENATIEVLCAPSSVELAPVLSILHQNYPNPFNPITEITFDLLSEQHVNLSVYDASGRLIETLLNSILLPGTYHSQWQSNGKPSGVYYSRLATTGSTQTKKMVLLK